MANREVEAFVLVANDGDSNRVIVENGVIIAGTDDVFLGLKLDEVAPSMGNVLKIGGATSGPIDEARMKHARILAGIAEEAQW